MIGVLIIIDTITGIKKAHKLKEKITSRKLSAIISKLALYEVTVIMFFLIDQFILNDIILTFFSVPFMLTKIVALVLASIEVMSINESIKQIEKILPRLNTQKIEYWVQNVVCENNYSDIDNIVYSSPNKIMETVTSKKTLIGLLSESSEVKSHINLPIETLLNVANKSIKGFIDNLDEDSKRDLSKVLMTEDVELSKEFDELKSKTIGKLSNITESLDDITSKKLQETIEQIQSDTFSKINYVRLYNLHNNL